MLRDKISLILKKMTYAALRVGRSPEEIKLVAVSKSVSTDKIIEAADLGLRIFGENRVQEAKEKIEKIRDFNIEWHMIGHLQRNKAKDAVKLFSMIQSVDSARLAETINREAQKIGKVQRVLLQVKLSDEESKYGVEEGELISLIETCQNLQYLRVEGLMTIPPYFENPEDVRPYFRKLREIRDSLLPRYPYLKELSMGMSHDFELAIEEGATMVRIGTALFGQRIQ